ncbi:MAG TPA: hypothetical protein VMG12_35770 [Polyangiaceae bacterium]|nr:hypothetical protein [Polyangiaceae bacterium]
MLLASIIILLGIAAWLVKSIVAPPKPPRAAPEAMLSLLPKYSENKQLRIEDHRSIDKSVSPPGG